MNFDYDINIIESTINNYVPDILSQIYEQKPDVIGFSCYIWNIEHVKKLCDLISKVLPETKIILGGPEVSYCPEEIFKEIHCNYIISGEGEKAFPMLLDYICGKCDITEVEGVSYIEDNIVKTIPKKNPLFMGDLPFAYENFDEIENRICYYEASRGCPFGCSYCLSSIEKGVRFAPIEKVKKELSVFLNKKVMQVKFVDRTFNADKNFALSIINFIKENDNGYTNFHFEVESRLLNDELLEALSTARKELFQIEVGVQSTNEQTLTAVNRKNDYEWLSYCVKKILNFGNIHIHLDLIAGLPFEDIKSFKNSFNMVCALEPHQLQLGFLKLLSGSHLKQKCDDFGISHTPFAPYEVLSTKWLSFDDVLYLKTIEDIVEVFYNSNRFVNSLKFLKKSFDGWYDLFEALALYKNKKGTDSLVHNKQSAYTFLSDFAKDTIPKNELKAFLCVLKLDFLLHEKPRSSPLWAIENEFDKNKIYDILSNNEKISELIPSYSTLSARELLKLTHTEKFPINPFTFEKKPAEFIFDYSDKDLWHNAKAIAL